MAGLFAPVDDTDFYLKLADAVDSHKKKYLITEPYDVNWSYDKTMRYVDSALVYNKDFQDYVALLLVNVKAD